MEILRRYLARIQAQIAGLTVSQKLLIGLLVVVMIGTIYGSVLWSAKPEMVVLIPQAMTAEDINKVEMYLKGKYEYQVSGDRIKVPSEKAYAIRGELYAAQALPKDTTVAFAELVRANNPFNSSENNARQWNYATQETLTKMLRYFPYIDDGTVIISRGERSGIGRDAVPSSASVTVKVRNNEGLTGNQVVAIVDMIRGAVAGLKREDVHITDGQRVYHAPSGDTPMPSDLLAYKKAMEDELVRKLYTMFGDIPTVKIAVNVVPDLTSRVKTTMTPDPKPVKAPIREEIKENNTSEGTAGNGGEPGVESNTKKVADTGGGGGHKNTTSMTNSNTEYKVEIGRTDEHVVTPPGTEIKDLTASISMPRSYFVSIYRRINKDQKADPEDDKLQPVIEREVKNAISRAKNTIGAKADEQVRVDWFDDTIVMRPMDAGVSGGMGSAVSMTAMISQYAKQGVLGVVALGVLGMMLMMVRRAVPAGSGADIDPTVFFGGNGGGGGSAGGGSSGSGKSRRKSEPGKMDVGDDVFGEANEGDAVLTGIELDDETLQSRKMVDEVSTMIKENPENAASLVKRWMAKSK